MSSFRTWSPAAAVRSGYNSDTGQPPSFLIAGLGNCLLCDDGIGVHAVWGLQNNPPPNAAVLEVGTHVFGAVPWLEGASRVLAIDAMDAGGPPGSIYVCNGRDILDSNRKVSLHELGLVSVLEFVPKDRWPEITVLGVQPARIEYGLDLSPTLQSVLPQVVQAAREIVTGWHHELASAAAACA